MFGPVTVPAEPKRVVALGWSDAEMALALGVEPVGVSDWQGFGGDGVGPWAEGLYTESPTRLGTTEVNFEELAALKPDLILNTRSAGEPTQHETLSKIAPTVAPPPDTPSYGTEWREQLRMVSTALGKQSEGQQRIAEVEGVFDEAAREHPRFAGKTVGVAGYHGRKWGAYLSGDPRVDFMQDLGFRNKPEIDELANDSFYVDVSNEQLDLLSADLTVVMAINGDPEQIREDPVLNQISAARAGNLVVLDDPTLVAAFSAGSTLGIKYAIERAVPLFAEHL
ncbi:iron-siderophore ABC transporter substrate-binding protein [Parasphingorhabdus pacifica]